jgi:hypothetical protein
LLIYNLNLRLTHYTFLLIIYNNFSCILKKFLSMPDLSRLLAKIEDKRAGMALQLYNDNGQ